MPRPRVQKPRLDPNLEIRETYRAVARSLRTQATAHDPLATRSGRGGGRRIGLLQDGVSSFLDGRFAVCQTSLFKHIKRSADPPLSFEVLAMHLGTTKQTLNEYANGKTVVSSAVWSWASSRYQKEIAVWKRPSLEERLAAAYGWAMAAILRHLLLGKVVVPPPEPANLSAARLPKGDAESTPSARPAFWKPPPDTVLRQSPRAIDPPSPDEFVILRTVFSRSDDDAIPVHGEIIGGRPIPQAIIAALARVLLRSREERRGNREATAASPESDAARKLRERMLNSVGREVQDALPVLISKWKSAFLLAADIVVLQWRTFDDDPPQEKPVTQAGGGP